MKQHNCFNIDNKKSIKGFLSTGSAVVTAAEKPAFPLQKINRKQLFYMVVFYNITVILIK